ncbi:MAG: hypothetical protein WBQ60_05115 [Asticcacaulis sp.]
MRKILMAMAVAALVIAPAAQAQDPNICPILRSVLDASNTHFKPIKGKKIESDTWKVTSNLAYADECQIDNVLTPEIRYTCYFRYFERTDTPAKVMSLGEAYADNIGACRPDLKRSPSDFVSTTAFKTIEFKDENGLRVSVTIFDNFFTVDVKEPNT